MTCVIARINLLVLNGVYMTKTQLRLHFHLFWRLLNHLKMKNKKLIKIAIDSPAAAGAGTLAKSISKHYNLLYLDTGKIYRLIAYLKINQKGKFNEKFLKKIQNLNLKKLQNKDLLSNEVGNEASLIAKDKNIRKLVHSFQIRCAYKPPKKFNGSCLDGRDITYKIIPDADFNFLLQQI